MPNDPRPHQHADDTDPWMKRIPRPEGPNPTGVGAAESGVTRLEQPRTGENPDLAARQIEPEWQPPQLTPRKITKTQERGFDRTYPGDRP